jgi:hypothetical protein
MATQYEIDIMMPANTVNELRNSGYSLYGFKAVRTANRGGAPTVWFQMQNFRQTTQVIWTTQYQAYVSTSQIIPNASITVNTAIGIDLGQTANVEESGHLSVAQQGPASAISIFNQSSMQWTCGILEMFAGSAAPVCALPSFGRMLNVIAPIEKVLLMFATAILSTGTVLVRSYAPGVLVDLTSAQKRSVSFDMNNGWSWDGGSWASPVAPQEDLVPILITGG